MMVRVIFMLAVMTGAARAADTTLDVVEHATGNAVSLHGGRAADNVGDVLTFSNPIFDATNKTRLGADQGYCVRLVAGKSWECHWTLMLAQGQLSVDGPFLDAADSVLSVTGGTGAYSGARGEMKLHARDSQGSAYDFSYHLK